MKVLLSTKWMPSRSRSLLPSESGAAVRHASAVLPHGSMAWFACLRIGWVGLLPPPEVSFPAKEERGPFSAGRPITRAQARSLLSESSNPSSPSVSQSSALIVRLRVCLHRNRGMFCWPSVGFLACELHTANSYIAHLPRSARMARWDEALQELS